MTGTLKVTYLKEPTSSANSITFYANGSTAHTNTTFVADVSASGNLSITGTSAFANVTITGVSSVRSIFETANVSATAATGTINIDFFNNDVVYFTTNASANSNINLRANSSVTANSAMNIGQSITIAFLATNGSTAYVCNAFAIDGSTQTIKWQNGSAPTTGSASAIDMYVFTAIKTAATPTYTVFGSQTKYA